MVKGRRSISDEFSRRSFLAGIAGIALGRSKSAWAAEPGSSFLAIGDWGTASAEQKKLAIEMGRTAAAAGARFVISTGDNFYRDGVVSTEDSQWKTSYEDIYDAPSLMVPWYPVLGNHDHRGNVRAQVDYTQRSLRWRMPATYYTHSEVLSDGTRTQFFFLDTDPIQRQYASWTGRFVGNDQHTWLERELVSSNARWKIVVGHHPVFSGEPGKASQALMNWLAPLLERHRVQVYLNGHSHNLEHIVVRGVHYLTSGAGANPRSAKSLPGTRFVSRGEMGFLLARLLPHAIDFEFRNDLGDSLHHATI